MFILVLIAALIACSIYILRRFPALKFDQSYLYITKNKTEEAINIDSIVLFKLTAVEVNNRSMWKLKYQENGQVKAIRYFFYTWDPNLRSFIKLLEERNIEVIRYYHPMDFDI